VVSEIFANNLKLSGDGKIKECLEAVAGIVFSGGGGGDIG
jgi:hypothetical protein